MQAIIQYVLSALTAFIIAGGGSLMTVLISGYNINDRTWLAAVVLGLMAASKDIRSLMRMPPVAPGDTTDLNKPTEPK
jgi:hypothetical protein